MDKPILVLQMQRMGDLVLTFPLLLWLRRLHPGREIWVVGEERFFSGMYPVSPEAVYFPWTAAERLATRGYSLVLNLSHRPEAAALAGRLRADEVIGPHDDAGGVRRINGAWQLYRASLTGCNRHNRFHWAELNALDCVPLAHIAATRFDPPRRLPPAERSVGIFVGASDAAKRPSPDFLAALARECLRRGLRPVLFGGPGETEIAAAVARGAGERLLDLSGRLSLTEFVAVGQSMALFLTPDTGPMHLAAWSGLRTLNLSLGNVNPWETGPYQAGHHVLRAAISCRGCWQCDRPALCCHDHFNARRTALLAERLVTRGAPGEVRLPGMELAATGKSPETGLYDLLPYAEAASLAPSARDAAGRFWQAFFGWRFGLWDEAMAVDAAAGLARFHPPLSAALGRSLPPFVRGLAKGLSGAMPEDFWRSAPPFFRPLASWLQLFLANGDFALPVRREALAAAEACLGLLR
ncbi:glycosyl transferase family 9 [Desulfovibrio sp. X2]|uniref:glycosyltransferase family 9 protein n=1 Tax=Desulfovibrio sp. X2 TaxID=941449 RepID=UPI0003589073|nr:glycosyltransferase family 9 protein [Desulfovibrio sp. X2]EPR43889.1 glycosyl transferase family 9 [Desulfovibrio sp. X2]